MAGELEGYGRRDTGKEWVLTLLRDFLLPDHTTTGDLRLYPSHIFGPIHSFIPQCLNLISRILIRQLKQAIEVLGS